MELVEEVLDEGSLDRLYNLTVGFWEPREIVIKGKGEVAHRVELCSVRHSSHFPVKQEILICENGPLNT